MGRKMQSKRHCECNARVIGNTVFLVSKKTLRGERIPNLSDDTIGSRKYERTKYGSKFDHE